MCPKVLNCKVNDLIELLKAYGPQGIGTPQHENRTPLVMDSISETALSFLGNPPPYSYTNYQAGLLGKTIKQLFEILIILI